MRLTCLINITYLLTYVSVRDTVTVRWCNNFPGLIIRRLYEFYFAKGLTELYETAGPWTLGGGMRPIESHSSCVCFTQ